VAPVRANRRAVMPMPRPALEPEVMPDGIGVVLASEEAEAEGDAGAEDSASWGRGGVGSVEGSVTVIVLEVVIVRLVEANGGSGEKDDRVGSGAKKVARF